MMLPDENRGSDAVVACIQFEPIFGDIDANLSMIERAVAAAAKRGAEIIVLPELADTGYAFESKGELEQLAAEIPHGTSSVRLSKLAVQHDVYIICGLAERDGNIFYNAAAAFGPGGFIGKYRKLHLWNQEKLYFSAGNVGLPVFKTRYGTIGVAICYDGWFPETFRQLAMKGAILVCVPTNWVPMLGHHDDLEPMANVLHKAAAHSNGIYIACADRVGTERGQPFIGRSLIVAPTGLPIGGPASAKGHEIIIASLNLSEVASNQQINPFNHVFGDRRPDVYG